MTDEGQSDSSKASGMTVKSSPPAHQILDAIVVEVPAALWEAVQQDFDQTLVPGWTHSQETILQQQTPLLQSEATPSLKVYE